MTVYILLAAAVLVFVISWIKESRTKDTVGNQEPAKDSNESYRLQASKLKNIKMDEDKYRLAKVVLGILFLVVLYLFALNGRYSKIDGCIFLDKWTEKSVIINIDY